MRIIYVYTPSQADEMVKGKLPPQTHEWLIGGAYIATGRRKRMIQLRMIRHTAPNYVLQKIMEQQKKITLMVRR